MGSFRSDTPVDYIGHRYLTNALEQSTSQHLLLITSLGCGDTWQNLSDRAKAGFGITVREKTLAEAWLQPLGNKTVFHNTSLFTPITNHKPQH